MKQLLLIWFFAIFTFFSFSQNIEGEWQFDYILPDSVENGKNLKPISKNDKMKICSDGTFYYNIKKINLIANGKWELKENNLYLHYNSPSDTTRNYQITTYKNTLILNENNINYAFVKTKSGFAIS